MRKKANELVTGDIAYRPRDGAVISVGKKEVAFTAVLCDGSIHSYKMPREIYADENPTVEVLGPTIDISDLTARHIDNGEGFEEYVFLESDIAGKCIHGNVIARESEPIDDSIRLAVCKILGNRGFAGYERYRDEPAEREKGE